jgi:hypothetical protein
MITVKECFNAIYEGIPEGATCHVAAMTKDETGFHPSEILNLPTYFDGTYTVCFGRWIGGRKGNRQWKAVGPDISDRPASAFEGFFGEAYDAYLKKALAEVGS